MVEIKLFGNRRRFSFVFVKNSKRHARDIVFWKRTIITANKDYHKSCVLAHLHCLQFDSDMQIVCEV